MGSTPRTQCGQSRQGALPLVLIAPEGKVRILSGLFQDGDMQDPPRPLRTVRAGDEGGARCLSTRCTRTWVHVGTLTPVHTPRTHVHDHTHMSIHVHNHTHVHTQAHVCTITYTHVHTYTLTHTPRAAVTLGSPLRRGALDRVLTDARGPTLREGEMG